MKNRTGELRETITDILRQPIKIDLVNVRKFKDTKGKKNERVEQILKACKEYLIFRDGSEITLEQ